MQKIYNKLNSHQYLNNNDLEKFISIYSNSKVKTKFLDIGSTVSFYDIRSNTIFLNKKFRKVNLKPLISFTKNYSNISEKNFLVDLYNLDTITTLLHELRHAQQIKEIKNNTNPIAKLLEENYNFRKSMPKLYEKNHDLYYFEYDAVISSLIEMLKILSKCKNLNKNSIIEYNRLMSCFIYHSYGNKYKDDGVSNVYDNFTSPISYTIFLSNIIKDKKRKDRLKASIKNILSKSNNEYLKLLSGCKLSYKTINLLYNISIKNYNTYNLLNDIKNIEKNENKSKTKMI